MAHSNQLPARLEAVFVVVEMEEMALVYERSKSETVLKVKRHFTSVVVIKIEKGLLGEKVRVMARVSLVKVEKRNCSEGQKTPYICDCVR